MARRVALEPQQEMTERDALLWLARERRGLLTTSERPAVVAESERRLHAFDQMVGGLAQFRRRGQLAFPLIAPVRELLAAPGRS